MLFLAINRALEVFVAKDGKDIEIILTEKLASVCNFTLSKQAKYGNPLLDVVIFTCTETTVSQATKVLSLNSGALMRVTHVQWSTMR